MEDSECIALDFKASVHPLKLLFFILNLSSFCSDSWEHVLFDFCVFWSLNFSEGSLLVLQHIDGYCELLFRIRFEWFLMPLDANTVLDDLFSGLYNYTSALYELVMHDLKHDAFF